MSPELCRAERFFEVREAARAWAAAGVIDATALEAVKAAYPDDRGRLGPALRALAFVLTWFGVGFLAAFFGLALDMNDRTLFPFLIVFGLGLVALTELQVGPLKRAQGGSEDATAWAAMFCLLAGSVWILDQAVGWSGRRMEIAALGVAAVLLGLAAWRWGGAILAFGSACCLLGAVSRLPSGRLWLAFLGGCVLGLGLVSETSSRLCPGHRRAGRALQAAGAVGLYLAVHIGSWDAGLVEDVTGLVHHASPLRPFFIGATAVLPVLLIGVAIAWRRRHLLLLGCLAVVASFVTLRSYVHVAPLWVVLAGSGLACLGLAIGLERWLRGGRERARGGFTADPLFDDERRLRALEVVLSAAQAGKGPAPASSEPGTFRGGGGGSGGGGASDHF